MTVVDHDAAVTGKPDEGAELGTDRRSFLRLGAFTAAATAAAGVAGIATAGSAEAANGGNLIIGQTNTGTSSTTLSGGSSFVASGGTSYVITGTSHAALVGTTGEAGSVGVYGTSSNTSTSEGAVGVKGSVSNGFDIAVWGQHSAGGTAIYGVSATGAGAYLKSTGAGGIGAYVESASGPALQIAGTTLSTVPPTTGFWSAGSMLMKSGTLYYCWSSGTGTASKWVRMSGALVPFGVPKRAYDSTKSGGAIPGGSARTITVAKNSTNTPVGVSAAALSITVLRTHDSGFITAFPASQSAPKTRTLSWWGSRQAHTTSTIVKLSPTGKIKIKATKKTHVIVDVLGYYP
jgi:hypothetical protein